MQNPSGQKVLALCHAPATMESWEIFNDFVDEQAKSVLGAGKSAYQLRLACEELFSNIIRHATNGEVVAPCPAMIWLRAYILVHGKSALVIEIEDNGHHFDPCFQKTRSVATDMPIGQRPIGGLGLFLVQKSVDKVEYQWVNQRNRYRLYASLPRAS